MELKLDQEPASVDQDPILLVFLDTIKSYDNLDCGRLLKTLEEYRAGKTVRGIIEELWERH